MAFAEGGFDGKAAMLYVGQEMSEVTLDRQKTLMLTKRVAQPGISMIDLRQRRWRLVIQLAVVINKPVDDGWHRAHEPHLEVNNVALLHS